MHRYLAIAVILFLTLPAGCAKERPAAGAPDQLSPQEVQRLRQEGNPLLVNVMSIIECMDARIPGSVCLPCEGVAKNLGSVATDKERPLVFYCQSPRCARSCLAVEEAKKLGYRKAYLMQGGLPAWKAAGYRTESPERIPRQPVHSLKPAQVKQWLDEGQKMVILDIRTRERFDQGHIPGAVSVPLQELHRRYAEIPQDSLIVVVDSSGDQSFLAASYLARKGFGDVVRLFGGMDRWSALTAGKRS